MPHIIGERVILRDYRQEDLADIRKWVNDADLTRYLSRRFVPAQTQNMTEAFLSGILEGHRDGYFFVIADKETGAYIGQVDLFGINSINRNCELGVIIGTHANLSQGIGTEAITLLLDFGFCQANMHRIELWVHADNKRAVRCYEKCGFVHEGRRRQYEFVDGKYHDVLLMAALRDQWLPAYGK